MNEAVRKYVGIATLVITDTTEAQVLGGMVIYTGWRKLRAKKFFLGL